MKTYLRNDIRIDVEASGAEVLMHVGYPHGLVTTAAVPRHAFDAASAGDKAPLEHWLGRTAVPLVPQSGPLDSDALDRVTLSIGERAWSAIDWEALAGKRPGFVRVTDVLARVDTIPLILPLRVLESGGPPVLPGPLQLLFGNADRSEAVLDASVKRGELAEFVLPSGWPTVDVLHLRDDAIPLATDGRPRPWFGRFLERYQTRLLVVECRSSIALRRWRSIAQMLVERAGPAVWLFPAVPDPRVWEVVYGDIVHDRPLDWIRADLAAAWSTSGPPGALPVGALFVGGAREELLRYSALARRAPDAARVPLRSTTSPSDPRVPGIDFTTIATDALMESALQSRVDVASGNVILSVEQPARLIRFGAGAAARLAERGVYAPGVEAAIARLQSANPSLSELASAAVEDAVPLGSLGPDAAENAVTRALREVGSVSELQFEDHESDGMLPLAARLAVARNLARQWGGVQEPRRDAARHVNIEFLRTEARADGGSPLRRIEQRGARLHAGQVVHLGVQIGAKNELVVTLGSSALVEELDRSNAQLALEVGVSGLDFDVVGDPVQALLLEPGLPSDLLTFAVRPKKQTSVPGVARLRVSLFRENHLVQSFLVAALLCGTEEVKAAEAFASALGVEAGEVAEVDAWLADAGPLGYLTRLEFSMAAAPDAGSLRRRGLTLVVNHSAGEQVVTLKGSDLFEVHRDDFGAHVKDLRKALDRVTVDQIGAYAYLGHGDENAGRPDALADVLWPLASAGWELCFKLVPNEEDRAAVRQQLLADGGLQAAHIVASDVIPWSLVYDRKVRSYAQAMAGPAASRRTPELCRAGIPAVDEDQRAADCGQREACLLHRAQQGRRVQAGEAALDAADVLCPLRFWGYRVPIEVPAHQTRGVAGRPAQGVATTIAAAAPPRFAAVLNPNLEQADEHRRHLAERLKVFETSLIETADPRRFGRQDVLDLLARADLDLVYLYCHGIARRETSSGSLGPGLDFGRAHDAKAPMLTDLIPASDFDAPAWAHAPLVFMNGCSTAGFSPYTPSELVRAFVQGRRAAAVVGTEVTVWEVLAREFALSFFEAFIGRRRSAGDALLAARRALLAKNNPLGLVYTLYGSSNLVLQANPAVGRPPATPP